MSSAFYSNPCFDAKKDRISLGNGSFKINFNRFARLYYTSNPKLKEKLAYVLFVCSRKEERAIEKSKIFPISQSCASILNRISFFSS